MTDNQIVKGASAGIIVHADTEFPDFTDVNCLLHFGRIFSAVEVLTELIPKFRNCLIGIVITNLVFIADYRKYIHLFYYIIHVISSLY